MSMTKEQRFEQLRENSKSKKVNEFIFVTDDLYATIKKFTDNFEYYNWVIEERNRCDGIDAGRELIAVSEQADGISLCLVQPLEGDTIYNRFMLSFGKGLMGFGEIIKSSQWLSTLEKFSHRGIKVVEHSNNDVWLELSEEIGGAIHLTRVETIPPEHEEGKKLVQICLVTDDVLRLAHTMCEILDIGPWEIGNMNNRTAVGVYSDGFTKNKFPMFSFLVGMGFYGNIEIELIQPQTGPLPYFAFLNRRGTGFHHIKEALPTEQWDSKLENVTNIGIGNLLSGKVGPCSWCNLATEEYFGAVYELGDSNPMTKLPDGYDPYLVC